MTLPPESQPTRKRPGLERLAPGLTRYAALYLGLLLVYLALGFDRLGQHTPFNHFALQAEAWLHGHLDLGGAPPAYAQGNDFARFEQRWFVPFPSFPAVLLVPWVALAGSAEKVPDALVFIALAPLGPVLLWAALERLRATGLSRCSSAESLWLSAGLALGSAYCFSAVQGTVWFAAHVVGAALAAGYLLASIEARSPLLAGLCLGLALWTRPPLLFAWPLFAAELWRRSGSSETAGAPIALSARVRRMIGPGLLFCAPLALLGALAVVHNWVRFGEGLNFGYQYLEIAWRSRIEKWGLFHAHYLPRNLGVALTSLPWLRPFRISGHGLALWITTPAWLLLLRPVRTTLLHKPLLVTVGAVALPTLLYQNSGWLQFGYRFSNDYAVFLFAALATCGRTLGFGFRALMVWAIAVNLWGAVTFDRAAFRAWYDRAPPHQVYQPD
jgi:hypothetical protein